ncbi:NPCBM/NEW2 domain-containing protein [Paenibacillus ihumii]|uniref:NPCBM/NEW2 domain-containing protein n=1 Tax=Paenibacillus ihumii TaxID=687436 RepID=UPI0006D84B5C|nr:NPCBM/NEW2 domain-containing protein [Paenibacillus ihumii]
MNKAKRRISGFLAFVLGLSCLGITATDHRVSADSQAASYQEAYVSDLDWSSIKHGKVKTQKDQIAAANPTGKKMKMNGVTYEKGLGTHADSKITYQINGEYERFSSVIGIDDEALNNSKLPTNVVFAVYGDGNKLYESPHFTAKPYVGPLTIDVDVSGVNELSLEVNGHAAGSNPQTTSYADWAEARLSLGDPSERTAASLASSIRTIAQPEKGQTILSLPFVPEGFTIEIASSDREDIIPKDAQIFPIASDVKVTLVLLVTKLANGETAATVPLEVLVPGVQPTETANKTALQAELSNAQAYYDNAVEGTEVGQYPTGAKEELRVAIAKATSVYEDVNASQYVVNQTTAELHKAVLSFLAKAIAGEGETLESVSLISDRTTLNLDGVAQVQLSGKLSNGADADLKNAFVKYSVSNPNVIASVEPTENGAEVRAGTKLSSPGTASLTATVTLGGVTRTADLPFKVQFAADQPFQHEYHQTLTMKMFMAENNGTVKMTFEQALEAVKKIDHLTRGIPKIIYLVGWQFDGHDTGYPALNVVNPKLKREQDVKAEDSLKWLMDEAFKYNTTISLHINMLDASAESPLWNTYLEKDVIAREADGSLRKYVWGYPISFTREWEEGLTTKRIDELLELLPIQRAGTIHIDAFHQNIPKLEAGFISPYHKITSQQEAETQKKIIRYFRDKGVDVTAEFDKSYRVDPLIGLQPMAWHIRWSASEQFKIPASLYTGGDGGDERLGTGMLGEGIIKSDPVNLRGFIDDFALKTLPWYYLNRLDRISDTNGTVTFSDGVTSRKAGDGSLVIERKGEALRNGGDIFFPAAWNENKYKEIIAYSKSGYEGKLWTLPDNWTGVESLDIYEIGQEGLTLLTQEVPVQNGQVGLTLSAGQAVSIFPSGTDFTPAPEPFALIEPANGDTSVDPASVVLRWEHSPGADRYRVTVSENPSLQPAVWSTVTEETIAKVAGLSHDRAYYWKVTAMKGEAGKEVDNTGGPNSFITRAEAPAPETGGGNGSGGGSSSGGNSPGSTLTSPPGNETKQPDQANVQVLTDKDLLSFNDGGTVEIHVREGAEAIVLTPSALQKLDSRSLLVRQGGAAVEISGETFGQWIHSVFPKAANQAKVILKLSPLSPVEQQQFIAANPLRYVNVQQAGDFVKLSIAIESEGVAKELKQWEEGVVLHLSLSSRDGSLAAVYTLQNGKLQRLSGMHSAAEGKLEAEIRSSGSYGLLNSLSAFKDVSRNHWAFEAISSFAAKQWINGTKEGLFEPGRPITRAEFVFVLASALELSGGGSANFTDLPANAWYEDQVGAAFQAGIIFGVDSSSFAPDQQLTRQEMTVMLMRAYAVLHETGESATTAAAAAFDDASRIAPWAMDDVKSAAALGILKGRGSKLFEPKAPTTRAEAVAAIQRLGSLLGRE